MSKFIIGALVVVAGFLITLKSEWLLHNLGRVGWAEQHLGMEGGSRLFYKLLGVLAILLGLFVITGLWSDILGGITKLFIR